MAVSRRPPQRPGLTARRPPLAAAARLVHEQCRPPRPGPTTQHPPFAASTRLARNAAVLRPGPTTRRPTLAAEARLSRGRVARRASLSARCYGGAASPLLSFPSPPNRTASCLRDGGVACPWPRCNHCPHGAAAAAAPLPSTAPRPDRAASCPPGDSAAFRRPCHGSTSAQPTVARPRPQRCCRCRPLRPWCSASSCVLRISF